MNRLITMMVPALVVSSVAMAQSPDPRIAEMREQVAEQRAQVEGHRELGQLEEWRKAMEITLYGAWDSLLGLTEIMTGLIVRLEEVERRLEVVGESTIASADSLLELNRDQLELYRLILAVDDWSIEVERRLSELEGRLE